MKESQNGITASSSYGATKGRARWSSRAAFYFAAVGSAVGFGNIWRFPSLATDFGGGAFFVPYLLAFFVVGLPLMFLEIGLGQYHQTGDVGAFGGIHKRLRGIGVCSIAGTYVLRPVYGILFAWILRAFFDSFSDDAPWLNPDVNGSEAFSYFFNEIVEQDTLGDDNRPTRLVGINVGYSAVSWFITWLCVAWGVRWTGRVTYFTMGLPIVLLFLFLGRALTLEGSSNGVKAYIGHWDMSLLTKQGEIWSTAVSQIIFSLSLTGGVMTAYGSNCPRTEPALLNSTVVAVANSMYSFVAGFAVLGSLGHLAYLEDTDVESIGLRKGFGLVFGTWPVILGQIPGGVHWVRLLFVTLYLLGLDSAFSGVEAVLIVLRDTALFRGVTNWKLAAGLCFSFFLLSLPMCTDAGFKLLDTFDFYINFMFFLLAFLETFAAGWIYGIEDQIESLGAWPNVVFCFANFGSIVLACGLWFGLKSVWAGFVALILFYGVFTALAVFLAYKRVQADGRLLGLALHDLFLKNVLDLKTEFEMVIGWVPTVWAFSMRYLIPNILLVLFVNLAVSTNDAGESKFGHYNEFAVWPFQMIGILGVLFLAILFLVGVLRPGLYACFIPPTDERKGDEEAHGDKNDVDSDQNKEEEDYVGRKGNKFLRERAEDKYGNEEEELEC